MSSKLLMNSIALMYGGVLNCSTHLMEVHLYECRNEAGSYESLGRLSSALMKFQVGARSIICQTTEQLDLESSMWVLILCIIPREYWFIET